MGFGVDESSVDELHFVEAFDTLQAVGQKLTAFELCLDPGSGGYVVPVIKM